MLYLVLEMYWIPPVQKITNSNSPASLASLVNQWQDNITVWHSRWQLLGFQIKFVLNSFLNLCFYSAWNRCFSEPDSPLKARVFQNLNPCVIGAGVIFKTWIPTWARCFSKHESLSRYFSKLWIPIHSITVPGTGVFQNLNPYLEQVFFQNLILHLEQLFFQTWFQNSKP